MACLVLCSHAFRFVPYAALADAFAACGAGACAASAPTRSADGCRCLQARSPRLIGTSRRANSIETHVALPWANPERRECLRIILSFIGAEVRTRGGAPQEGCADMAS